MSDDYRTSEKNAFLKKFGYADYIQTALKGDASRRIFIRLSKSGKNYILIDANPDAGEEPTAYAAITDILRKNDLNAPEILAADMNQGFFIVEDFGDSLFSDMLQTDLSKEEFLYKSALDALIAVQKIPVDNDVVSLTDNITYKIHDYDVHRLICEAKLFTQWYVPYLTKRPISNVALDEFTAILTGLLTPVTNQNHVLTLRDYHAANMMYMPKQTGVKQVGLLDFQDALIGNIAYDVVSLLQDARRDVSPVLEQKMLDYYIKTANIKNTDDFKRDYIILGVQRNLKILGIFIRLWVRDKKPNYLSYLPRVWNYLETDLKDKSVRPLSDWFDRWLPLPMRHEQIAV